MVEAMPTVFVGLLSLILCADEPTIAIRTLATQRPDELHILVVDRDNRRVRGARVVLSYTCNNETCHTPPIATDAAGSSWWHGIDRNHHQSIKITVFHPDYGPPQQKQLSWKLMPQLVELRPPGEPTVHRHEVAETSQRVGSPLWCYASPCMYQCAPVICYRPVVYVYYPVYCCYPY